MPDAAAFCPGCGQGMPPVERVQGKVGALSRTLAGALAYCTIVPAIVFLAYRTVQPGSLRSLSFVSVHRFLAGCSSDWRRSCGRRPFYWVSFLCWVTWQSWLLSMVASLGFLAIWVVLVVKALQGEMFKLPLVGDFAEQHASTN